MNPRWIPLVLAAALAGCNLAPIYERPAAPVPGNLPQGEAYPALADDNAVIADSGWRDFFTEPALRDVIELALLNNRDLRVALANVEQARAQYGVQRAALFPAISADAGLDASRSRNSGNGDEDGGSGGVQRSYAANVGLAAFELDLFGRLRNLSAAAQEEFLATAAAQQTTRISLIAEVASAYVSLASAREQLSITRQALASRQRVLELTRARQRAGVASGLDTRQADTSYQQVRADVAQFTANAAQARNALILLVGGEVPDALLPSDLEQPALTLASLPIGLPSDVLLARPDVRAAEHRLMAQHANIGAARAAFFPRISLSAVLGTAGGSLSDLFSAGSRTWSFAPGANLPLFDGGANRNNLDFAQASRDAAVATYEQTIQIAFREVADALARRATIDEQVQAQQDLTRSAAEALAIAEARYRVGSDTFLNVLSSQQTLQSAQVNRVTSSATRASNMIELYRALGGGQLEADEDGTAVGSSR
ncbi:MAG: efflux transporter outer membrane subunit [Panacagrimonas sp.]